MVFKKSKGILVSVLLLLCFIVIVLAAACDYGGMKDSEGKAANDEGRLKIGFSMATLQEERWQRDRDIFVAKAKERNADVIVQNADNDNEEQLKQVKYLLDQKIDILVIVPQNAEKASSAVQMAKRAGVKVIAYDRLVRNANVDMYVSFDNVAVGQKMAEELVKVVPEGNYIIINGAKTDYNCYMFNEGYKKVLQPYIDSGRIKIISEAWAEDWRREDAYKCVVNALQGPERVDAIIAANDSLAWAAVDALSEQRLAGKVPVAGHDADLSGCQRVCEGTQLTTIYNPIHKIAEATADIAVKMAKGEKIEVNNTINDGKFDVPYYMIEPIAVTKDNMVDTIIHDGFHLLEDVYRNVPKSQWPSPE